MSDGRKKLSAFEQLKSLVKGKKDVKNTKDNSSFNHHNKNQKCSTNQVKNTAGHNNQQMRTPQFGQKMNRQQQQTNKVGTSNQEALTISVNIQDQMEVESRRLFGWLCRNFPNCFNPKAKKPLKVGINDDIIKAFLERTQRQVHFGVLTRVLRRYVGDQAYQKAIIEHKKRFNLQGEAIEDISDEHLEHAQVRLEELKEKARLRAQGIDPRTVMPKKEEEKDAQAEKEKEISVQPEDAQSDE